MKSTALIGRLDKCTCTPRALGHHRALGVANCAQCANGVRKRKRVEQRLNPEGCGTEVGCWNRARHADGLIVDLMDGFIEDAT